jgi:3-dehydroquinate synthase class II
MAVVQAQAEKIAQLTNENVQLMAAVAMLQKQVALNNGQVEDVTDEVVLDSDARDHIRDVTDQVVGAEMNPKVGPFVGEPGQREHKAEITS